MARILIAGCGDVGSCLGRSLAAEGHTVYGLRRRTVALPQAIRPVVADLTDPGTLRDLPSPLDYVFYTASASGQTEEAYRSAYVEGVRNLLAHILSQEPPLRRLFFTSSTSVYGQSGGEWVDESSPTEPERFQGRLMLEAEGLLRESPVPTVILRLAGIYGPGRTRLIDSVRDGSLKLPRAGRVYTNRIHRDDAAGALQHLMQMKEPEDLYLGVDDAPCDLREVAEWIAQRLATGPQATDDPREPAHRPRASRRCRNTKLRETGYAFAYSTYREGYAAVLAHYVNSRRY